MAAHEPTGKNKIFVVDRPVPFTRCDAAAGSAREVGRRCGHIWHVLVDPARLGSYLTDSRSRAKTRADRARRRQPPRCCGRQRVLFIRRSTCLLWINPTYSWRC